MSEENILIIDHDTKENVATEDLDKKPQQLFDDILNNKKGEYFFSISPVTHINITFPLLKMYIPLYPGWALIAAKPF